MSAPRWTRISRSGSTMEIDPAHSRVHFENAAVPPISQNGEIRNKRRALSPLASESHFDEPGGFDSSIEDAWSPEPPGSQSSQCSDASFTSFSSSQDDYMRSPTPTQEVPTQPIPPGPAPGRRPLGKEDTLMSIDVTNQSATAAGIAMVLTDALEQRFRSMFEKMQQRQREDLSMLADSIRVLTMVEVGDLKIELANMRTELADLRSQIRRLREEM